MPREHKPRPCAAYHLYWSDAEYRCCFCPEPISKGSEIWWARIDGRDRRAHVGCAQRMLEQLVVVRDSKGKSEDLE